MAPDGRHFEQGASTWSDSRPPTGKGTISSALLTARGAPPPRALARRRRFASLPSNLRADVLRRLPAGALAKAGRRSGWQAGASLGPQALRPCPSADPGSRIPDHETTNHSLELSLPPN